MTLTINAVLIDSEDPRRLVDFYKLLGVPIAEERHGKELHWGCMLDGLHFAIHQKINVGTSHPIAISFAVVDVDKLVSDLKKHNITITMEPCNRPYGRLASVLDPDGNTVYLHRS